MQSGVIYFLCVASVLVMASPASAWWGGESKKKIATLEYALSLQQQEHTKELKLLHHARETEKKKLTALEEQIQALKRDIAHHEQLLAERNAAYNELLQRYDTALDEIKKRNDETVPLH